MTLRSRVYKLLPGKNCGICGAGSCSSFANQLIMDKKTTSECIFFIFPDYSKNLKQLERYIEKLSSRPHPSVYARTTRPCTENPEEIMLEGSLAKSCHSFIDLHLVHRMMEYYPWKCRTSIHMGLVEILSSDGLIPSRKEPMKLLLFENGRFIIRRAKDAKFANYFLKENLIYLYPALVCQNCGNTVVEHFSGVVNCNLLFPGTKIDIPEGTEKIRLKDGIYSSLKELYLRYIDNPAISWIKLMGVKISMEVIENLLSKKPEKLKFIRKAIFSEVWDLPTTGEFTLMKGFSVEEMVMLASFYRAQRIYELVKNCENWI
jgi:hypothetical protein